MVRDAIRVPAKAILQNAGLEGSLMVGRMLDHAAGDLNHAWGFSLRSKNKEEAVDLVKAGIIDPLLVVRSALVNAASVASLLATTECCITEIPEKKKDLPMPPGGGMGGGMDY